MGKKWFILKRGAGKELCGYLVWSERAKGEVLGQIKLHWLNQSWANSRPCLFSVRLFFRKGHTAKRKKYQPYRSISIGYSVVPNNIACSFPFSYKTIFLDHLLKLSCGIPSRYALIVFLHWAGGWIWWPRGPLSTSLFYRSMILWGWIKKVRFHTVDT